MRMMLLFPQRGSFPTLTLKAEEPLTFIVHINGHIIELFGLDITKLGQSGIYFAKSGINYSQIKNLARRGASSTWFTTVQCSAQWKPMYNQYKFFQILYLWLLNAGDCKTNAGPTQLRDIKSKKLHKLSIKCVIKVRQSQHQITLKQISFLEFHLHFLKFPQCSGQKGKNQF